MLAETHALSVTQSLCHSHNVPRALPAGVAIAAAVTVAALVLLLVLLLRKRHITDRLSTAFGVASPQQQQKPCNAAPGAMPFPGGKYHRQHGGGKPPFAGGAGSGSGDAAWLVAGDNPDEAAMLCTPDISQEQVRVPVKARLLCKIF